MYPGITGEQKAAIAEEITNVITRIAQKPAIYVTVDIQEVEEKDWAEDVYRAEIMPKLEILYKKPGYNPFA
jgi:4-oxalocrotonate tautomerase